MTADVRRLAEKVRNQSYGDTDRLVDALRQMVQFMASGELLVRPSAGRGTTLELLLPVG